MRCTHVFWLQFVWLSAVCLAFQLQSSGSAIQYAQRQIDELANVSQTRVKSPLAKPSKLFQDNKIGPSDTLLLVPNLKLAFCFIPKNACSEFNRLMNILNGDRSHLGAICTPEAPNFRSSWRHFDGVDPDAILKDSTWTKAVFLRDPLERLVSTYRDKCEPPMPCHGLGCFASSFHEAVDKLRGPEESTNAHYEPQDEVCGGLSRHIHKYDYIGHLSYDFAHVHKQVEDMLHLAIRRSARKTNVHLMETRISDEFIQGAINQSFDMLSEKDKCEPYYSTSPPEICRYFSPSGPNQRFAHNHFTTGDMFASYYTRFTLSAARHYYDIDYKRLPGLRLPEWTKKVRSLAVGTGISVTSYMSVAAVVFLVSVMH